PHHLARSRCGQSHARSVAQHEPRVVGDKEIRMSAEMTSQPPRIARWLVELFAAPDEADAIVGDLVEEFHDAAIAHGDAAARGRFWRQALQTIRDLSFTPWRSMRTDGRRSIQLLIGVLTGVVALALSWPINWMMNEAAGKLASNLPIYYYVPATWFWQITLLA